MSPFPLERVLMTEPAEMYRYTHAQMRHKTGLDDRMTALCGAVVPGSSFASL
jgi:hypothetical protein